MSPGENYINKYKEIAISEMRRTGVPASITLAQGMIESDYGRSKLSREANNHFGIKCHNGWTGPTVNHHDDKKDDCFRKYNNPEESFHDHSEFLRSGSRYKFLFDISATDYKGWAYGLKKAGYATNPDYANMLIRKIELNNLIIYDRENLSDKKTKNLPDKINITSDNSSPTPMTASAGNNVVVARIPRVMENNRIQYIIVKDGDTKTKLDEEFQLLKWELAKYNELRDDFKPVPGQILYLQPKRDKAESGKEYYTTIEGDTFYLISQKFGIKLRSLYEMNRVEAGTEPGPGNKIWLRSIKPNH